MYAGEGLMMVKGPVVDMSKPISSVCDDGGVLVVITREGVAAYDAAMAAAAAAHEASAAAKVSA